MSTKTSEQHLKEVAHHRSLVLLVTVLLSSKNLPHELEILSALTVNLANPAIQEIHVLLQDEIDADVKESDGACDHLVDVMSAYDLPTHGSDKLHCTAVFTNPTYKDLTIYLNEKLAGKLVLLSNADVVFDHTLANVDVERLEGGKTAFVLAVHQPSYMNSTVGKYKWCETQTRCGFGWIDGWSSVGTSWDAYVFKSPLPSMDLSHVNHPMNLMGAEASYAYTLHVRGGMEVANDCHNVQAFHWHCGKKSHDSWKSYASRDAVPERIGPLHPRPAYTWDSNPICQQGSLVNIKSREINFLITDASTVARLCCPFNQSSCEQEFLDRFYEDPTTIPMLGRQVFCASPSDVYCLHYVGDPQAELVQVCPPSSLKSWPQDAEDNCKALWGSKTWPYRLNSTLYPVPHTVSREYNYDGGRWERGDRILLFTEGRSATVSLSQELHQHAAAQLGCKFDYGKKIYDWQRCMKTHDSIEAYDWMQQAPDKSRIWMFSIVRNPLAAKLSEFALRYYTRIYGNEGKEPSLSRQSFNKWTNHARAKAFLPLLEEKPWLHVLEPLTGFDAFSMQEPWDQDGFKFRQLRYGRNTTVNLVILRFEDIDHWHHVFNRFIPGLNWTSEALKSTTRTEDAHTEWMQVEKDQSQFIACESGLFSNFTSDDWYTLLSSYSSFYSPEDCVAELRRQCDYK